MSGITLTKLNGGLGRKALTQDMICGLVCGGITTAAYTTAGGLGTVVKLNSLADCETYGFTAAYDSTNHVLTHYHVKEFFRINPNGVLYLMVVDNTTTPVTLTNMCDVTLNYVQKLITDDTSGAVGTVRAVGVVLNPLTSYTPTLTTGLDGDVITAVVKAQALADAAYAAHYPLDVVIIEGRQFNGSASSAVDLTTKSAGNVAVVIGADPAISATHAINNGYAAVGTALGSVSLRAVDESIAQVGTPGQANSGDLSNASTGEYASAGLSNNGKTTALSAANLAVLQTKGFIFCMKYMGYPGVYWNQSNTCTVTTSDFCTIENNRTLNKVSRLVYTGLMPYVSSRLLTNSDSTLQAAQLKALESAGEIACKPMIEAQEIPNIDVYVDPDQNVVSGSSLNIAFNFGANAIAKSINITVGFNA